MNINGNIISKSQSICPVCHKPVEAFYVERDGKVYFEKYCRKHGLCSTVAA